MAVKPEGGIGLLTVIPITRRVTAASSVKTDW